MHKIFLGFSIHFSGNKMLEYFDIDTTHPEKISKFEQLFGCDYIEPGSFEVYDKDEYKDYGFNVSILEKLLPFKIDSENFSQIDFNLAKSVFYIQTNQIQRNEAQGIRLLGPFKIDKFIYE